MKKKTSYFWIILMISVIVLLLFVFLGIFILPEDSTSLLRILVPISLVNFIMNIVILSYIIINKR